MNCLYIEQLLVLLSSADSVVQSVLGAGLTTLVITPEIVTAEIDKVGVSEVVTHESDNVSTMAATPGVKGETSVQSKYIIIHNFHLKTQVFSLNQTQLKVLSASDIIIIVSATMSMSCHNHLLL